MKKTIRQIIEDIGTNEFARRVGLDQSYISKVRRGLRPGSLDLLGRAKAVFGDELDIDASVDVVEVSSAGCEVDHEQP